MEKVTDKINALPAGATYFSLEFFPPKTLPVSPALPKKKKKQRQTSNR